jgi:rRNA-processing protein CGR1
MLDYILQKAGLRRGSHSENQPDISKESSQKNSAEKSGHTAPLLADTATQTESDSGVGRRVSGKEWKVTKKPMRIRALGVQKKDWEKKRAKKLEEQLAKVKERELVEEKKQVQRDRVAAIKAKEEAKEEKQRYEKLAEKMHAKKIARLRKREKRNKMLKER